MHERAATRRTSAKGQVRDDRSASERVCAQNMAEVRSARGRRIRDLRRRAIRRRRRDGVMSVEDWLLALHL
jgi:hypothetical protein